MTKRRRIHILKDGERPEDMDLWPGDEVWDKNCRELGYVDDESRYVPIKELS